MKYTNLILAAGLAAAVFSAGLAAADNTAESGEKAAAEAKAKAERSREISKRHNELVKQLRGAYDAVDAAKQTEFLKAVFDNAVQPDVPENVFRDAESQVMNSLNRNKALEKERFLEYYPKFIAAASGDVKADFISKYADYAEKAKFMTAVEAQDLRLTALQVKALTPTCLFGLKVKLNDLKGADELVPALLASQKDDKAKSRVLNDIVIRAFKQKKVFGSDHTDKYYRMWVDLAETADQKSDRMGAYAEFMYEYCMRPDEEIRKYLDSRYALNGLTPDGKAHCYLRDLNRINGDSDEFQKIFEKAYGEVKASAQARAILYQSLKSFGGLRKAPRCSAELIEKYAIPDKEGNGWITLATYAKQLDNRIEVTGRTLEKVFADAREDLASCRKTLLAKQAMFAQAESDAKAQAAAFEKKRPGIKDKAELDKAGEAVKAARAAADAKRQDVLHAKEAFTAANNRYKFSSEALISYYAAIGVRYYESANPVYQQKIADVLLTYLDLEGQYIYTWDFCLTAKRIFEHLYAADNFSGIAKMISDLEKLKQKIDPKDTRQIANIDETIFGGKRFYALQAYKEEDYEKALTLLKPYIECKNKAFRNDALDPYVRSLVAVGREAEAVPYLEDWIKSVPWYLANRCKEQADQLKARVEANAKK